MNKLNMTLKINNNETLKSESKNISNKKSERVQAQLSTITSISQESFSGIRIIKSFTNEENTLKVFFNSCKEYTKRYKKTHAGESIVKWYKDNSPFLPIIGVTPFVQAMPDDVKNIDSVIAYRNYYKKYKVGFAKWSHTETPKWFQEKKMTNSLLVRKK